MLSPESSFISRPVVQNSSVATKDKRGHCSTSYTALDSSVVFSIVSVFLTAVSPYLMLRLGGLFSSLSVVVAVAV